jgi:hypothetical protein
MPHVWRGESGLCNPADREDPTPARELAGERDSRFDLGSCRRAVRARGARVRRHDVPEEDIALDVQLLEHAVHDRRRRLGRPGARQQSLRCKRDPGNARAPVAGSLTDEQDRRVGALLEVARKALREMVVTVLVERVADLSGG